MLIPYTELTRKRSINVKYTENLTHPSRPFSAVFRGIVQIDGVRDLRPYMWARS